MSRRGFLASSASVMAASCHRAPGKRLDTRPHIVLIVLDTVRRDHTTLHGHARPTTPVLERLADTGSVFENAWSTTCWTVPSHASLFTGLYPCAHQAHWENMVMVNELETLPELLSAHGYETAGISENPVIGPGANFHRGFGRFTNTAYKPYAENEACAAFKTVVAERGAAPLFIFVNLVEAHNPYDTSGAFSGAFLTDPAYKDVAVDVAMDAWLRGEDRPDTKAMKHRAEHYDACVRYVDDILGKMVDTLDEADIMDNTLLIVTSDHGENIGDHGMIGHQLCLYESLLRVPLVIRYPEGLQPGGRVSAPVQLTDVFPTVLEAAGVASVAPPRSARNLLADELPEEDRPILAEYYIHGKFSWPDTRERWKHPGILKYKRRLKSLLVNGTKYIRYSDGTEELFDLHADPDELENLAAQQAWLDRKQGLAAQLEELLRECKAAAPVPERLQNVNEDMEDELKSVGYL